MVARSKRFAFSGIMPVRRTESVSHRSSMERMLEFPLSALCTAEAEICGFIFWAFGSLIWAFGSLFWAFGSLFLGLFVAVARGHSRQ